MHIYEVSKFLADTPSVTTHAIQSLDPFNKAHPLIILLQSSDETIYFDVYSQNRADCENEDIPKIHLMLKNVHGIHQQKNI